MHTFFHLDTLVILCKKSLYFNKYSCKETINNRDILKKIFIEGDSQTLHGDSSLQIP